MLPIVVEAGVVPASDATTTVGVLAAKAAFITNPIVSTAIDMRRIIVVSFRSIGLRGSVFGQGSVSQRACQNGSDRCSGAIAAGECGCYS
jgi:hypothetical protein